MATSKTPSIEGMTSSVFDNGRRGNPRPGCDCEQCFGYCLVDSDKALRATLDKKPAVAGISELFE